MRPRPAPAHRPGPTTGAVTLPVGLGLVVSPGLREGDCCPWPRVREPASKGLGGARALSWDIVDEWGVQSFPASDPPANW